MRTTQLRTVARRAAVALVLASAAGCGGSGSNYSTPPAPSPTPTPTPGPLSAATVNATAGLAFVPATVNLVLGGNVTFAFGSVGHNVYFDNDPAGAPENITGTNADVSITRTFNTPGTYNYYCHIHPGMRGTVVVGGD